MSKLPFLGVEKIEILSHTCPEIRISFKPEGNCVVTALLRGLDAVCFLSDLNAFTDTRLTAAFEVKPKGRYA